jgi:hypothetical protein
MVGEDQPVSAQPADTVATCCRAEAPPYSGYTQDGDRLARWRIYESGHVAKSEDRTWRDAQGAML